jgi:replicative DNA helicase
MQVVDKLPPQNIEAEQAVIGSCMLDQNAASKSVEILRNASDFYREAHQVIYNCILELMNKGDAVDILTVSNELKKAKKFDDIGGSVYLTGLLDVIPTTGNVEHYAKIIQEKAILRNLIYAGGSIADLGFNEEEEAASLLDRAESMIFKIAQERISEDFSPLQKILFDTYEKISELYSRRAHVTGVATHYRNLDYLTAGLQPSDLIILAARPGMGKTAFALNIALNAITRDNRPVAVFSLEMSKEQLAQRLLCCHAGIDANRLRTGFLAEADWPRLTRSMNELTEAPLYIDDTPNLSVLEMRSKARRLKKNYGLDLLIVDYIQLIRGSTRTDNRVQELSEISRQLKGLAKELHIPIICLSQLSRKVEERNDKRPLLSDLRESGAIEQDADIVMFIYRGQYYANKDSSEAQDNTSEIIIAKQRNGPLGVAKLGFLGQYTRFVDLEDYHE